jgi:hypothetical protein
MKNTKLIVCMSLIGMVAQLQAANIIFNFKQTTANGTDLFAGSSGALISNTSSPLGFFSLGFVNSNFDFTTATRTTILSAIGNSWIASSSANWVALSSSGGTGTAGKVNVSFSNGGNGYDTTTLGWAGKKLVGVVSEQFDPTTFASGATFSEATNIAIVRGGAAWDSILATDASQTPTTMTLDTADFNVLVGTYTASVGGWGTGANRYDTITLVGNAVAIPEPSVASLFALGTVGLVALRARRKS